MLDYTDISGKVEDIKNALNNLYESKLFEVMKKIDSICRSKDIEAVFILK